MSDSNWGQGCRQKSTKLSKGAANQKRLGNTALTRVITVHLQIIFTFKKTWDEFIRLGWNRRKRWRSHVKEQFCKEQRTVWNKVIKTSSFGKFISSWMKKYKQRKTSWLMWKIIKRKKTNWSERSKKINFIKIEPKCDICFLRCLSLL